MKRTDVHIFVGLRPPYNVHVVFSFIPQGNEKKSTINSEMTSTNKKVLSNLAKFVNIIMNKFS